MVKNPDYNVLVFEECQRCKQFEQNYKFKNCGFDVECKDNITIQTFECTKCNFNWTRKYYYE